MVRLNVVRSSNAAVVKSQPLVAVFTGATSGIGQFTVNALAATHAKDGKGLRVYIVGRKKASAEKTILECQKVCPAGQFRFVQAGDLALLKDVDRICTEIMQMEREEAKSTGQTARVDFLCMTQAYLAFEKRNETKEGLDSLMSLMYYSRMRFILQLLPLLLASSLPAHVVSVFGPGRDTKIFLDDLSLRDPKHYSFYNMGCHVAYLTTMFLENLAARHPGQLSLSHYYPALVLHDGFFNERLPSWIKWAFTIFMPLMRLVAVPQAESGERVVYHTSPRFPPRSSNAVEDKPKTIGNIEVATSSDGVVGGGAYRTNWNGEMVPLTKGYKKLRENGFYEKVWNHTMKAFEDIEAGRVL